jgi:hypothetical protein
MRNPSKFKPDSSLEGVSPEDVMDLCLEERHIDNAEVSEIKLDAYPLMAEMYLFENGFNVEIIASSTFYIVNSLKEGIELNPNEIQLDSGNGTFIVKNKESRGLYKLDVSLSFESDKISTVTGIICKNDTLVQRMAFKRKIENPNDVGIGSLSGFIELNENDVLDLRIASSVINTNVKVEDFNFSIFRYKKRL